MASPKVELVRFAVAQPTAERAEVVVAQRYGYAEGAMVVESRYTLYGDGTLDFEQTYTPEGTLPELGVLGSVWAVNKALQRIDWYGYGPMESYPDRKRAARVARWTSDVARQYTHYPRPQDSGNKEQVTEWALLDAQGKGVVITALDAPFSAKVLPYTAQQLATTTHDCFLTEHPTVNYLTLDAAVLGLGNSSCGPGVLKKYAIEKRPHTIRLRFSKQ